MLDTLLTEDCDLSNPEVMEAFFIQALYWSLGAGLLEDGRVKFDNYIKYVASMTMKDTDSEPAGPGVYCNRATNLFYASSGCMATTNQLHTWQQSCIGPNGCATHFLISQPFILEGWVRNKIH